MNASRAFSLLLWLGLSGLLLLVAAGTRLALGAWPDGGNLHNTTDGLCVIVPVHGDFLSHTLSYSVAILLLGVLGLSLRYVGQQTVAFRGLMTDIAGAVPGESDELLQEVMARARIASKVLVIPSSRRMAFTAGLWRPRIFVTTELVNVLADKQLEAILLHEECHARRRDPLRTVLARALATMLFFLPVLRDLASYHHVSKEVEADAAAIRRQRTRVHIASALHALVASDSPATAGVVAFNEAASVKARVEALRTGRWQGTSFALSTLTWSVVGVLLLIILVARPVSEVHGWWTVALSLTACPAWLVLYWMTRSPHLDGNVR